MQPHRPARQDPEPVDAAVLLRVLERELEPEADAEHRPLLGDPRAQRVVEPLPPQLVHRRAGRADARQHGEVGAGDVVDELGAEPAQRDLDRADVPGAVVADGDLHSMPFVDGMPDDSTRSAVLQRAADRLVGGLGGVVRVAAGRLDVDRHPPRLREAAEEVLRHARLGLERELREGPAAEIDGGAGERVVHRHGRVAVAGDPAAVAERAVERLAERERGVLDGVVVAGLEVAGALDDEVEPGVEGELLEEVVVDAGAGLHATRGSRRRARAGRRSASRRSRAGAGRARPPPRRPARAGRAAGRASRRAGRRRPGRGS